MEPEFLFCLYPPIRGRSTELLPAEAGRLEENVSYGLKSFAHDLVIRKLSPASSGSVPYFMSSRLCELVRYFSIPKF